MTQSTPGPAAPPRGTRTAFLPNDLDPTVFDEGFLRQLERLLLLAALARSGRPEGRPAERQAGPERRIRRLSRLHARRRPAATRLERLRPPREALRQAIRRGRGRDDHDPPRHIGVHGDGPAGETCLREARGGGARVHRPGIRGSGRGQCAGRPGEPPPDAASRLRTGLPAAIQPVGDPGVARTDGPRRRCASCRRPAPWTRGRGPDVRSPRSPRRIASSASSRRPDPS